MKLRALALICLALFAANARAEPYPASWPSLQTGFFAGFRNGGCPDFAGTYDLDATQPLPFEDMPDRMAKIAPFDTLTISGNTREGLKLRYERSRTTIARWEAQLSESERTLVARLRSREHRLGHDFAHLDDRSYAEYIGQWIPQPYVVKFWVFNSQYGCRKGWLLSGNPSPGLAHLRRGHPDYARDKSGALIQQNYRLSGIGIPAAFVGQVPLYTNRASTWRRYASTIQPDVFETPMPWKTEAVKDARPLPPPPQPSGLIDATAVRRSVFAALPVGVRVVRIEPFDDKSTSAPVRFRVTVAAPSNKAVSDLHKALNNPVSSAEQPNASAQSLYAMGLAAELTLVAAEPGGGMRAELAIHERK